MFIYLFTFSAQNEVASGRNHIYEDRQKREELVPQLLNVHDQIPIRKPSTLGHWVCAKRSDLSRKFAKKDMNRGPRKMADDARKLSLGCLRSDLAHSEVAVASPKVKCLNILSNTSCGMDNHNSSNLDPKLLETHCSADSLMVGTSSAPSETCHSSLKIRKTFASKKSVFPGTRVLLEGISADKSGKFIALEKIEHHGSTLYQSRRRGTKYFPGNELSDCSTEDFGCISPRANETGNAHDQSDFSEHQEVSLDIADPDAPAQDTKLDPSSEEHVESVVRNEALAQRSTSNEEMQCENAVSNEVISHNFPTASREAEPV